MMYSGRRAVCLISCATFKNHVFDDAHVGVSLSAPPLTSATARRRFRGGDPLQKVLIRV